MGTEILAQMDRLLETDLITNISIIKMDLQFRLTKPWRMIAIHEYTSDIERTYGFPIPPPIEEEVMSTASPIVWIVDWTGSNLHQIPAVYGPYIQASNTALAILGATQALCLGRECTLNIEPIGVGRVKDIQMAYGRCVI